jgi:hypothetical protein
MNPDLQQLYSNIAKAAQKGIAPDRLDAYVLHTTKGLYPSVQALAEQLASSSAKKPSLVPASMSPMAAFGRGMTISGAMSPAEKNTQAGALRSAAQGATFNFADELYGLMKGLPGSSGYTEARDAVRANDAAFQKEHPAIALGANIAGGLIPSVATGAMGILPVTAGAADAPLLARLGLLAKSGAKAGALFGAGNSAGVAPELRDVPQSMALGGVVGGVSGGLLAPTLGGANAAGRWVGGKWNALRNPAQAAVEASDMDLIRAMQNNEMTPATAMDAFRQADALVPGEPVFANVLGGAGNRTLRAAKNIDPSLEKPAAAYMQQAIEGKPSRIAGFLEQGFAPLNSGQPLTSAAVGDAREAARKGLRAAARQIYPADDVQVPIGDAPILQVPAVKQAMQAVSENQLPVPGPKTTPWQAATFPGSERRHPTFGVLQETELRLRDKAFAMGTGASERSALLRNADELQAAITSELPGYAEMAKKYAYASGPFNQFGDAPTESATAAIFQGNAADQIAAVRKVMSHANPESINALRKTFVESVTNKLYSLDANKTGSGVAGTLENLMNDRKDLVKLLFPNEQEFNRFVERMGVQEQMTATARAISGNSNSIQQAMDAGVGDELANAAIVGSVFGGIKRMVARATARAGLHAIDDAFGASGANRTGRLLMSHANNPELKAAIAGMQRQAAEDAARKQLLFVRHGRTVPGLLGMAVGALSGGDR